MAPPEPILSMQPVLPHLSVRGRIRKCDQCLKRLIHPFCHPDRAFVLGIDEADNVIALQILKGIGDAPCRCFRRITLPPVGWMQRPPDLKLRPPLRKPRTHAANHLPGATFYKGKEPIPAQLPMTNSNGQPSPYRKPREGLAIDA